MSAPNSEFLTRFKGIETHQPKLDGRKPKELRILDPL